MGYGYTQILLGFSNGQICIGSETHSFLICISRCKNKKNTEKIVILILQMKRRENVLGRVVVVPLLYLTSLDCIENLINPHMNMRGHRKTFKAAQTVIIRISKGGPTNPLFYTEVAFSGSAGTPHIQKRMFFFIFV